MIKTKEINGLAPGNYSTIARKTGFTSQHIMRVIKGENTTTLDSAHNIASAAKVSLDELYKHIKRQRAVRARRVKTAVRRKKA